jgi:asparagine synthetase B (glutamine-hydrolysing)
MGRDRVGIHPLFYHYNGHRLVFGSEIKSIFMDSRIIGDLILRAFLISLPAGHLFHLIQPLRVSISFLQPIMLF